MESWGDPQVVMSSQMWFTDPCWDSAPHWERHRATVLPDSQGPMPTQDMGAAWVGDGGHSLEAGTGVPF